MKLPIICAGAGNQPPCKHFDADRPCAGGNCHAPSNMIFDYVLGGLRPRFPPDYMRALPDSYERHRCGPTAEMYEPAAVEPSAAPHDHV